MALSGNSRSKVVEVALTAGRAWQEWRGRALRPGLRCGQRRRVRGEEGAEGKSPFSRGSAVRRSVGWGGYSGRMMWYSASLRAARMYFPLMASAAPGGVASRLSMRFC